MSSSEIYAATIIVSGLFCVVLLVVVTRVGEKKIAELRARGVYPEDGKETDEDVARLLQSGQKILAIRCYRSLHKVGLKEAKDAVELLEKKTA